MAKVKGKPVDNSTKALTNWDAELAAAAEASAKVAAEQEGGGAKRITIRGGQMSIGENAVPGNTLVGIVCAFTMHNKFFTKEYDADEPSSPDCYAYGDSNDEMGPHDDAEDKQSTKCDGCPQNEFGSADKGKGKACRNTFQLLVLSVGTYDHKSDDFDAPTEAEDIEDAEAYMLSIPPTSLKAWSAYVKKMAGNLRPPWACFTTISVTPDPKTQWKLNFANCENIPASMLQAAKIRHEQGQKDLVVAYPKNSEREKPVAKGKPGKKRY